jgi:hypothetical protein
MLPNLIVPYQYYLFSLFQQEPLDYSETLNRLTVLGYSIGAHEFEDIKDVFLHTPAAELPDSLLYFPGHPVEYFIKGNESRRALEALVLTGTEFPVIQKAIKKIFKVEYTEEQHKIITFYFMNFDEMRFDHLKNYLGNIPEHYQLLFSSAADKNEFLVQHLLNLKPDLKDSDITKTITSDAFAQYQESLARKQPEEARKWAKLCLDMLAKKLETEDPDKERTNRATVEFDNMSDVASAPAIVDLTTIQGGTPVCPAK